MAGIEQRDRRCAVPAAPRMLYIVNCFPNYIETMIYREVGALLGRGIDVGVVSLRRPAENEVPEEAAALVERTRYVLPVSPVAFVRAHIRALVRHRASYLRTLWSVVSGSHGRWADRCRSFFHFCEAVYMLEDVEREGFEHVHAHWAVGSATCAMVLSRLSGIPFSFTAHAYDVWREQLLLREKVREARFVVTCTEYTRRHLIEAYAADPERVVCIYHGLDLTRFVPGEGAGDDPPMILAVGRLVEQKGLDVLIRACALLARRGVEFRCRIVGNGPLRHALERLAGDLGVAERVEFTGALVGDALIDAFRCAQVFALPCKRASDNDRDGIPNTIIEAMAMELPVVSTEFGAVPEIVEPGRNGLLVPVEDADALADGIASLLADPQARARLGRSGRELVRAKFELHASADAFIDVLCGKATPAEPVDSQHRTVAAYAASSMGTGHAER